jgi:hypothetical protein
MALRVRGTIARAPKLDYSDGLFLDRKVLILLWILSILEKSN